MNRRAALLLAFAALVACRTDERCKTCGMKVDPASAWRTTLHDAAGAVVAFDTPRCALLAWRRGKVAAATLRVRDYYDQREQDASNLRFVVGSDVAGPMGPELVPVDPGRVTKFMQDHGGERALALPEITEASLAAKP